MVRRWPLPPVERHPERPDAEMEEETGAVSVFRRPSHYANGNTRDRQGRLLTCEMDAQRLTRTEYDGTITVLADRFEGKRLTAPNDVVVKADGSIWFSDNGADTRGNYLGHKAPWEFPFRVYRLDPGTVLTIAVDDMKRPNGLAFSPDETLLYIVDTPGPGQRTIQVYDVVDQGTKVANRREFCSAEPGGSDGLRVDTDGNLWCAWAGGEAEDGVAVFAPDGTMIGRILLPERCANVFRRPEAQPPVHGREPVDLRPLCRDPGLERLTRPRLRSSATRSRIGERVAPVRSDGQGMGSAQEGLQLSPVCTASALHGICTQPKQLLSRGVRLLSLQCRHGPCTERRTSCAPLPWLSGRALARAAYGEFPLSTLSIAERVPRPTIAHVSSRPPKIPYGVSPVRLQAQAPRSSVWNLPPSRSALTSDPLTSLRTVRRWLQPSRRACACQAPRLCVRTLGAARPT